MAAKVPESRLQCNCFVLPLIHLHRSRRGVCIGTSLDPNGAAPDRARRWSRVRGSTVETVEGLVSALERAVSVVREERCGTVIDVRIVAGGLGSWYF
jgi:hypothetical protein